jgi:hypothetical protein
VIPPVDDGVFDALSADDRKWLDDARDQLHDFEEIVGETMNLMDGHRSPSELADALAVEFGVTIDVARLVEILAKLKLVYLSSG